MTNQQTSLGDISLPNGYAYQTLLNGNVSECIRFLNELIQQGFFIVVHYELTIIKENAPNRYDYIKSKLTFKNK